MVHKEKMTQKYKNNGIGIVIVLREDFLFILTGVMVAAVLLEAKNHYVYMEQQSSIWNGSSRRKKEVVVEFFSTINILQRKRLCVGLEAGWASSLPM